MFYRRKIILALLELFDGHLEKLRLQKLLFLFTQRQVAAEYEFIPYKLGCYSHSANADVKTMVEKGLLSDDTIGLIKQDKTAYIKVLKEVDRKALYDVKKLYGSMDGTALMRHTYVNYPYFAINSIKASEILNEEEIAKITKARPKSDKTMLFTIGYEGISLEQYLNRLIRHDVHVLVDVRRNPLSMKYGFSKNLLKRFCESVSIKYIHFPEVGIESDKRQELNTQQDYDNLFKVYKDINLKRTQETQKQILDVLGEHSRIALTCFESNICQCHRKPLSESIRALSGNNLELKHI